MSTEGFVKDYVTVLGKRIKTLREAKGMTQVILSNKCNFEKTALSRIEQGRTAPNIKTLLVIAKAFDISISELVNVEVETKS